MPVMWTAVIRPDVIACVLHVGVEAWCRIMRREQYPFQDYTLTQLVQLMLLLQPTTFTLTQQTHGNRASRFSESTIKQIFAYKKAFLCFSDTVLKGVIQCNFLFK